MSFDPTVPAQGAPLRSAPVRANFQALFDLIQAIGSITGAQVDSVSTLDPGQPASASLSVVGQTLHFDFGIPRGDTGPQGPSFASAQVDAVNSLNPGDPAQASVTFDGSTLRFSFGIPRGYDGMPGTNGIDGQPGTPGEVSQAELYAAIVGTSANSNAVTQLAQSADPNYNPSQIQDLIDKMNELIGALRR